MPRHVFDSPFASLSTIRATMQRTGANPKIIFCVWMMARKYAANDAEWHPLYRGHCATDAASLAAFLSS